MGGKTTVRFKAPILTVPLNNGLMGGYDKYLPVSTERVAKPHDLVPAFRRALEEVEAGRPAPLEVLTREEAVYPKYW